MTQGVVLSNALVRLRVALAVGAGVVAIVARLGILMDTSVLSALAPGRVPMSPLGVELVTILVGAILLIESRPASGSFRRLAIGFAAVVALLSLWSVWGHLLGFTMPLERWMAHGRPHFQFTSLLTSSALLGAALSVLFRWWPWAKSWGNRQTAAALALIPLIIGPVVLVSYAAGAPVLYGTDRIPMSLPSALCSVALGLSLTFATGCDTWPLAAFGLLSRKGKGGASATCGFSLRLAAIFLLLCIVVLTGGSFYLRGQLRATRERVHTELSTIADAKARQIGNWFNERHGYAERIFHGRLIQTQLHRFLAGSPQAPSEGDVRTWMEEAQKGTYRRVVLFDGQGRVRISVPPETTSNPGDADAAEIQMALGSQDVMTWGMHQHPGQPDIHMGLWVPIGPGSGAKAAGALLLTIDPRQFLYPLVQSWPTSSPSAETILVRREGDDVLYLNDLRHQAGAAMKLRLSLAANPKLPVVRAVLGEEGLMEGLDYRGAAVLEVLRKVPGTDWFMVAKVDAAEVYGPLRQRIWLGGIGLTGLVVLITAVLAFLLRHHDAEMVLKQLHLSQRFESLMREANDIILLMDQDGRILEANHQAAEHYGYPLSELLGMNAMDLSAPESRAEAQGLFDRTKAVGSSRFETFHHRQDGSIFPVEVSARGVQLDGEWRVITFTRDITDRRAHEREVQRMTQLYAALSQVNQAIVWSPTREALLDKICEVLVEFGHFDMAWIGWNDALTHQVTLAARYGDLKGYLDRIRVESGDSNLAKGPVGTAIRQGCPCVINDFMTADGTEPWREAAAESGFKSVAAFPVRQGGEVVAALAIYSREKDFFGTHEAALLVEAAMDVSFALDHLVGEERRNEIEAALLESERFLTEAQEAGEIGTYTWRIQEDWWKSSPVLDRIFGIGTDYPRDLKGWTALIAPEFRELMTAYVAGIIERHERFDLDYPIVRMADGATRWVHGQGDIQWSAEGQPVALVGVILDITERKLAERSLRKVSVAVEQSPLSMVITDPEGNIEYVNPAFTKATGYSAEEAKGQNPRILKSPITPPEQYRQMWAALANGEVWVGEFENLKKNGDPFQERATIAPVRDEAGALTGYIAIKEDITHLKKDQEERRSLEAQLHESQKLESLGSLAGGVAHDMNNVLGAILGLASSLREAADPLSQTAKNLDTIVNACMRGRGVVKSLLYFAHKDLQDEQPIDLNDLVKEMSQLLSYTTLKRVQMRMELREGIGLVRGDAGALSHALMNLCVNALDAMPGGGILCIQTGMTPDGCATLSVRDTGEGMTPEVLAKAKEPFFTTKPQGKGTGLGLAMVYGTMKAHEGDFDLHSLPGEGTEAILRFPASRMECPSVMSIPVPVVAEPPQTALNILLVDDDELIRESVAPMLEMLGHAVTPVPGGLQALHLLETGLPVDLVILDMNMPGMSGAEALPLILKLRPEVPILMATGYSDQEIAPLLEGRPRVSSLRKPFSMKEVQKKIAGLGIHQDSSSPSMKSTRL